MAAFTLQQLEAFFAIAENRSVSGAARQIFISQSSLSKTLSRLEENLGVQLFDRSASGVVLTPEGSMLFQRLKAAYQMMNRAIEDARFAQSGKTRSLRLGIHASCERSKEFQSIWSALDEYESAFPSVQVSENLLEYGELRSKLLTGELDAIITHSFTLTNQQALEIYRLQPLRFSVAMAAGHPLASEDPLDFTKLNGMTFFYIAMDGSAQEAEAARQRMHTAGILEPVVAPMPNIRSAAKAVVRGKGMMLTCHSHGFDTDEIHLVHAVDPPVSPYLVCAALAEPHKPELREFIKHLTAAKFE